MKRVNFAVFVRMLRKNKALSVINLFGLAIGVAGCLFIILYVSDELSYDAHQLNLNRIYRVTTEFASPGSNDHAVLSSSPLARELKANHAEVEGTVRFNFGNEVTIRAMGNLYREKAICFADASVFQVFSYPLLKGNPKTALASPNCLVLTRSIAQKYFGDEDPVGKTLSVDKSDRLVTGVMEDLPARSDLQFAMLGSMNEKDDDSAEGWFDFSYRTYILFRPAVLQRPDFVTAFEKQLQKIAEEKINKVLKADKQGIRAYLHLQPLKGLHFEKQLLYDTPKGSSSYLYLIGLAAFFLLLVGCLNYINFSIVQSLERCREVGIRKVIGARFAQLVARYLGESLLFTGIAMIVATVMVILLLPVFNSITGKAFFLSDLLQAPVVGGTVMVFLIVGLLAGSYPAFFASSMRPVDALKGNVTMSGGQLIRKASVVVQFIVSIGLIICTAITFRQMHFVRNFDLGFRKKNVVIVNLPGDSLSLLRANALRTNLMTQTAFNQATVVGLGGVPGAEVERGSVGVGVNGQSSERMVSYCISDADYLDVLQLKLKDGRYFDRNRSNDSQQSVLVNEAFVRTMGWKDPLEHTVTWGGKKDLSIIGVVKDFHYQSLHDRVEPQVIVSVENKAPGIIRNATNMLISLNPEAPVAEATNVLRREWSVIFPEDALVFQFLDENLNAQYTGEERAMNVFTCFSVLAIVVSCLGLSGLSSLTIRQRKKEIGIRKIVGAGFRSILFLFSKEYLSLIVVAFVVVSPMAWWLMAKWLETFSYRESIGSSVFVITAAGILLLSLITIGLSIHKISNSKPVSLIRES